MLTRSSALVSSVINPFRLFLEQIIRSIVDISTDCTVVFSTVAINLCQNFYHRPHPSHPHRQQLPLPSRVHLVPAPPSVSSSPSVLLPCFHRSYSFPCLRPAHPSSLLVAPSTDYFHSSVF